MSDLGLDFTSIMFPILLLMLFLFGVVIALLVKEVREWIVEIRKFLSQKIIKKRGKERLG
jgi:hypothetical protein